MRVVRPPFLLLAFAACARLGAAGPSLDDARSLYAAGRHDEALAVCDEIAATLAASDPGQAAVAHNIACVIQMNRGDHRAAVERCREALRLLGSADDPLRRSRTLNNLGLALQYVGEYDEAGSRFREALELNQARGDAEGQAINRANLVVLAIQAGHYAEALEESREVLALAAGHADAPWSAEQVRIARINQAVVFERLGAYREALDLYRQVLEQGGEADPQRRATLLVNLGVVYRNLGDPARAAEAYEDAVRAFEELGDRSGLSNAWLNLALVRHLNLGRPADAEPAYRRALDLAREAGDRAEEIQDLSYLGRLLLDLGRMDEAAASYESCLAASEASGSSEGRWKAREGLARVAAARGDSREALRGFEAAIAEIEGVRASLDDAPFRSRYFGDKRSVYAAAVDVLADLERAEPGQGFAERALETVQRAKARSLLDALGATRREAEPLGAGPIAERVGGELLLEYFAGERGLYAWAVQRGRVRMAALGPSGPVLEDAGAVHAALGRGEEPAPETLARLSQALLGSFGEIPAGADTVHVAPDGRLHYVPFELLQPQAGRAEPLIAAAAVDYLPSGSALAWTAPEHGAGRLGVAGLGAPAMPKANGDAPTPASLLVARFALGELPAAESELALIQGALPGPAEVYRGAEATEEAFAELGRRGAHVLHVASHAVVDEAEGRGAAILLTPSERSDGVLHPAEIAALDYRVDLTVLSACRTALSADEPGDALASLTGALLAAGSSAVVATLWDVDDAASRAFMEQFYHELGRGRRPAEALRRAKLRMLEDPYWGQATRWAAYVLVGRAEPVVGSSLGAPLWLAIIAASVLAASVLLFVLRRRRVS